MDIEISDPVLEFLTGTQQDSIDLPIKVIRSAKLKVMALKAISCPEELRNWKSFDYKPSVPNKHASINIIDNWHMELEHTKKQDKYRLIIHSIRNNNDGQ